ncbi:hypothetical protein GMORB2_1675 [Geosmithia morbida]|uniref:Uncharacterized protein n=1 Tax=Geosmithia morbida TaxID=1094350 RepID=A0A9P5D3I7_9HYPO|nr:uncharacterized protein GMORB2_1675 [Geosmithia morbida]KAF4121835.1 hypothetical protein GMORB2_1675 [Geosmithia morbida]
MNLEGTRQSSLLLSLPPELQMHISVQAALPDATSLALTCKTALGISRLRNLPTPDPVAHRAPWSADPSWQYTDLDSLNPECRCGQLETVLRQIRPRNARGHVDRTRSLCVDCVRYLPRRRSHWRARADALRSRYWDGEVQGDWDIAVLYFSTGVKMQCPPCRLREHGDIIDRDTVHGLTPAELASLAGA